MLRACTEGWTTRFCKHLTTTELLRILVSAYRRFFSPIASLRPSYEICLFVFKWCLSLIKCDPPDREPSTNYISHLVVWV